MNYDPSPAEIKEACRKIREGWSEEEHWRRSGNRRGWWTPTVRSEDMPTPDRTRDAA